MNAVPTIFCLLASLSVFVAAAPHQESSDKIQALENEMKSLRDSLDGLRHVISNQQEVIVKLTAQVDKSENASPTAPEFPGKPRDLPLRSVSTQGAASAMTEVYVSAHQVETTTYEVDQRVIYDGTLANPGNHYDPSTGIFTCPVDGTYFVNIDSLFHIVEDVGYRGQLNLLQGGSVIGGVYGNIADRAGYLQASSSVITFCNQGDQVYGSATAKSTVFGSRFSSFNVVLLALG